MSDSTPSSDASPTPGLAGYFPLIIRCLIGGTLMGLANLVPGISGGTMLLAAGVYPRFVNAIAEITTLKLKTVSLVTLGSVALAAGIAILAFAGPVKELVVHHRWIMYSLFIGLTLGGIPVVWKMAKPASGGLWGGVAGGFILMAIIAAFQSSGAKGSDASDAGFFMMLFAGVAGASAMILPGISGGYLLLVMGVYVPILDGISKIKDALKAVDVGAFMGPALGVALPVGIGVVVGILVVSNLLKYALAHFEKPTLGALLGFLGGAVIGLYPFQRGVAPVVGDIFKGKTMTEELITKIEPSKYPTEMFTPSIGQIFGSIALIAVGFGLTYLIARFGGSEETAEA